MDTGGASASQGQDNTQPAARLEPARLFSGIPNWLSFWVPIVTSLASFVISITSLFIAGQEPELAVTLPAQMRAVQAPTYTYLYLQPAFFSRGRNERSETIITLRLRAEPEQGGAAADFRCLEHGEWEWDVANRVASYKYLRDAVPLVVSPGSPQSPLCTFIGPSDWFFQAGVYRMTLEADRSVAATPLISTFTANIDQRHVDFWATNEGRQWIGVPIHQQ
jgi:hypothetical protein